MHVRLLESYVGRTPLTQVADPEGKHLTNGDGHFVMYLDSENRGTLLSSTRSMLYGNVTARVRSTGMPGAVTAFILMVRIASTSKTRKR